MKITPQILSIPPYFSTTWSNIAALRTIPQGLLYRLIVLFQDQTEVEVEGLGQAEIDLIFAAHARYMGRKERQTPSSAPVPFSLEGLKSLFGGDSVQIFSGGLHHNPDQSSLPPLPPELLEKIVQVFRSLRITEQPEALPPPEESCGCLYCQVVRALATPPEKQEEEELITEADLTFRSWDIEAKGKDLYSVTHPLDKGESYTVFLGTPIGCTCGHKDCEHIQAVLRS